MQNAADGAALVAERSSNLSMGARTAAARAFFDAEVGDMVANVTFNVTQLAGRRPPRRCARCRCR